MKKMVDEKSINPIYMFGYNLNDPNTQTEDIGDDPIQASIYGLKNLKIVIKNLEEWTTQKGQSYDDLQELYKELIGVYRRYVYHVIRLIGGVNQTLVNKGQYKTPYKNVPKSRQLSALSFLESNLFATQNWLMDKSLLSKMEDPNALRSLQSLQRAAIYRVLNHEQLNIMLSNQSTLVGRGLNPDELLNWFYETFFNSSATLDDSFMALQLHLSDHLIKLSTNEKLNPRIKATVLAVIDLINKKAKIKKRSKNYILKNHFQALEKQIKLLETKQSYIR
jgi:hypothetical protein